MLSFAQFLIETSFDIPYQSFSDMPFLTKPTTVQGPAYVRNRKQLPFVGDPIEFNVYRNNKVIDRVRMKTDSPAVVLRALADQGVDMRGINVHRVGKGPGYGSNRPRGPKWKLSR